MRLSRQRFFLAFLAFGYAFHFISKFLLNPHAWTILAPLQVVMFGPIDGLLQDPDPPPPFRLILLTVYWSLLALGLYEVLRKLLTRTR